MGFTCCSFHHTPSNVLQRLYNSLCITPKYLLGDSGLLDMINVKYLEQCKHSYLRKLESRGRADLDGVWFDSELCHLQRGAVPNPRLTAHVELQEREPVW